MAYSVDTAYHNLIMLLGPVIATLVALNVSPTIAIAAVGLSMLVGGLLLAVNAHSRAWVPEEREHGETRHAPLAGHAGPRPRGRDHGPVGRLHHHRHPRPRDPVRRGGPGRPRHVGHGRRRDHRDPVGRGEGEDDRPDERPARGDRPVRGGAAAAGAGPDRPADDARGHGRLDVHRPGERVLPRGDRRRPPAGHGRGRARIAVDDRGRRHGDRQRARRACWPSRSART